MNVANRVCLIALVLCTLRCGVGSIEEVGSLS